MTRMRHEELIYLAEEDLDVPGEDPASRYIAVQAKTLSDGRLWPPKNYELREIPVTDEVLEAGRRWVAWKSALPNDIRKLSQMRGTLTKVGGLVEVGIA